MHFGSMESAIHRLAFLYADKYDEISQKPIDSTQISIDGRNPKIFEVSFCLDETKIHEFDDWGDPGAMGTANKLRDELVRKNVVGELANGISALHKKLWTDLVTSKNWNKKEREYENRKFVGDGVARLGVETVVYRNSFEANGVPSYSYCFMCQPEKAVLKQIVDVPQDAFWHAVQVMRPKVPKVFTY